MADALDQATEEFLANDKSPSRKVNELDNRGSHFYLAMYWAQALAEQNEDSELKDRFTKVAKEMDASAETILNELIDAQGSPVEIGGYFQPNEKLTSDAMRPSNTLNSLLDSIK